MATASQISSLGGTMFSVAVVRLIVRVLYWSTLAKLHPPVGLRYTNSDDWLPNITPSIALYGDAVNVKLAEYGAVGDFVSGNGRDEIAVKASGSVHVFDIGSLPAGTNTTAAVAGVDGLAPGCIRKR